jgi:hypothetical protein
MFETIRFASSRKLCNELAAGEHGPPQPPHNVDVIRQSHMPFYLRKSISAGPFRFNLSKGGLGLSVGVRGLRIGTGPRDHYIHAGRGGLYYRTSLGRAGERTSPGATSVAFGDADRHRHLGAGDAVAMVEVESGDVLQMREGRFTDMLDDINKKQAQQSFAQAFGGLAIAIGLVALFVAGPPGAVIMAMALPAWGIGRWLDAYKRRTVLFYGLNPAASAAYEAVTRAFDDLAACQGKWHVEAGGAVQDLATWKRNAGASHLVRRSPTVLEYAAPQVVATNVTPPSIRVGKQILYLLPDAMLVVDGVRVGAVGYEELGFQRQDSRFIEEGRVPGDAEVVGHTWKHPNKSGGPDRRFANNHQIPICRYEVLHLTSPSWLNEMVEVSRAGIGAAFGEALKNLGRLMASPDGGRIEGSPRLAAR